jgi:glycosyltransferase involved in cell wall biosynthesis
VFTGDLRDYRNKYRNSGHFQSLVDRAKELGVYQNCRFLGLVPKLDQIGLIRSAVAVIQPTLFEGSPGGLAVYDAIAVGQRVILSDIPINWEIRSWVDEYFAPADARALFLAMCKAEDRNALQRPKDLLLREGQERRLQCGQVLQSAFALAIERCEPQRGRRSSG